ncbi:MAG: twin-arginine translocase subunit TatC [Acidimicrobiales bacterium]
MTDLADAAQGQMTLVEHLAELRGRLIKSFVAIAIGAVICWIAYNQILDFLLEPYCRTLPPEQRDAAGVFGSGCKLFVRDPLEPFSVRLTVAGYGGLALAMPVVLWQAWRFVAPGLYRHEKRYAIPFVLSGVLLFFLGAGLAYWSVPRALSFLANIGGEELIALFSPQAYLGFIIKMMVAFGIGFEFPIALIALQIVGMLDNRTLRRVRSYAIVGIVVLVAVITPSGDPFTLMVLSVPMYLFYEISILYGIIHDRRRRKRETATG